MIRKSVTLSSKTTSTARMGLLPEMALSGCLQLGTRFRRSNLSSEDFQLKLLLNRRKKIDSLTVIRTTPHAS